MEVTEGLAPLNLDLLEVSSDRHGRTSSPRPAACPGRRRRRSSGQYRMSVSDGEEAEEEHGSPVSRRHWSPCCSSSSASSAGSPGYTPPGSAGSDAAKGGGNCCRRRPSISDLTDSARMTPEALAERGAGFPWQHAVPGLFKFEMGTSPSGGGGAEMERARNFCILDTPELCRGSSPSPEEEAALNGREPGESDSKEERSPRALQQSFEEHLLRARHHSPKGKPDANWLSPQRLAELRCPASLVGLDDTKGFCDRDDLPAMPPGLPPARPVQRRPLKRARPEKGGG